MNNPIQDAIARLDSATNNDGRKFHIMLVGCTEDILQAIHTFHALNYVDVGSWSPIVPVPNSTNMMSILTRYRSN